MDQLIDQIVLKTGISRDQANQAAQAVVAFLEGDDKWPGPIAFHLYGVVGGESASVANRACEALGGMVGMEG